jgi:TolA-binding protein
VEKFEAEINRLGHLSDKLRKLNIWIENSRKREERLEQEIALLRQSKEEQHRVILELKEQLSAAKAAGASGSKMDAELRQYITGLIREIDKSLKNWED